MLCFGPKVDLDLDIALEHINIWYIELSLSGELSLDKRFHSYINNCEDYPVLLRAINDKRINVVKYLISIGADVNLQHRPLRSAIMISSRDIVKLLLSNGADINGTPCKHEFYPSFMLLISRIIGDSVTYVTRYIDILNMLKPGDVSNKNIVKGFALAARYDHAPLLYIIANLGFNWYAKGRINMVTATFAYRFDREIIIPYIRQTNHILYRRITDESRPVNILIKTSQYQAAISLLSRRNPRARVGWKLVEYEQICEPLIAYLKAEQDKHRELFWTWPAGIMVHRDEWW
jgi:hypothetical protein